MNDRDRSKKNRKYGFFAVWRSIFDSEIWTSKPADYLKIFLFCIGKAAHEPKIEKGVRLERGELLTSYRILAKQLNFFKGFILIKPASNRIKKIINELKRLNLIIIKNFSMKGPMKGPMKVPMKEPDTIIVKVLQYNVYQQLKFHEGPHEGTNEGTNEGLGGGCKRNAHAEKEPPINHYNHCIYYSRESVCTRSESRASEKSKKEKKKKHTHDSFNFSIPEIKKEFIGQGVDERTAGVEAGKFFNYNEMKGWKIESLSAAVRIWIQRMNESEKPGEPGQDQYEKYRKIQERIKNEKKNNKG